MSDSGKHRSITFTPGGNNLVYSNNPESIKSSSTKYTMQTELTKNIPFIHDFYHHNNTGTKMRFGVVVKNTTSSTAKIRVRQVAINSGTSFQTVSANMHLNYNKSTNDQYITISANSCKWIDICSITISNNVLACGRVNITAASDGLVSRIAYGLPTCSASAVFNASRDVSDGNSRTSALFRYDTRYANIDLGIETGYKDFIICGGSDYYVGFNNNEFPDSNTSVLAGKNYMPRAGGDNAKCYYLLYGNYSIYYILNFSNRVGKSIKIKQVDDRSCRCLMQIDGKTWITQIIGTDGLTLNVENISTLKFVLTGSNMGSIEFIIL